MHQTSIHAEICAYVVIDNVSFKTTRVYHYANTPMRYEEIFEGGKKRYF